MHVIMASRSVTVGPVAVLFSGTRLRALFGMDQLAWPASVRDSLRRNARPFCMNAAQASTITSNSNATAWMEPLASYPRCRHDCTSHNNQTT